MAISERIKSIRKDRGLTIADMSDFTGISVGSYHRLENKGDDISVTQLKIIAKALDVPFYELLSNEVMEDKDNKGLNYSELVTEINNQFSSKFEDKENSTLRLIVTMVYASAIMLQVGNMTFTDTGGKQYSIPLNQLGDVTVRDLKNKGWKFHIEDTDNEKLMDFFYLIVNILNRF